MIAGARAMRAAPKRRQKHPPPRVIAVDVDDTLMVRGRVNAPLVEWCRRKRAEGFALILWSSRGEAHARRAAELAGLEDCFAVILSKPGYIVDDQGWSWVKYTRVVDRETIHARQPTREGADLGK